MRHAKTIAALLAVSGLLSISTYLYLGGRHRGVQIDHAIRQNEEPSAAAERKAADRLFDTNPLEAKRLYRAFVASYRNDADPKVQDEVGTSRIRLGYLAAKENDF